MKSWWPTQVYSKIKRSKLKDEHVINNGPDQLLQRAQKSKRLKAMANLFPDQASDSETSLLSDSSSPGSTNGSMRKYLCKDDEVWVTRLSNKNDCPAEKQNFVAIFQADGHHRQHGEEWKQWLSSKEENLKTLYLDRDIDV